MDLFPKIKGIVLALFKIESGIGGKIFESNPVFLCQGVVFVGKDIGSGLDQGMEAEVLVIEFAVDNLVVILAAVDDANLTAKLKNFFNHLIGSQFLERGLIAAGLIVLEEPSKGIDHKGIVLGDDGE